MKAVGWMTGTFPPMAKMGMAELSIARWKLSIR